MAGSREMHEAAIKYLQSIGKCASVSAMGNMCTITANHSGRKHQAQVMGGIDDGKRLEEWDW